MTTAQVIRITAAFLVLGQTEGLAQTLPTGWTVGGTDPQGYDVRTDTQTVHGGTRSASIHWTTRAKPDVFASLAQAVSAESFRGKRVRFSAFVQTENVEQFAGLWMRLDGPDRMVGLDNMTERPILGTRAWRRYSIVLDVPADTRRLVFGIILRGRGHLWIDDCVIDFVDARQPVTGMVTEFLLRLPPSTTKPIAIHHREPMNLDFEK